MKTNQTTGTRGPWAGWLRQLRFAGLGIALVAALPLWAQVTVTATPGTCADVNGPGTQSWSNPGNALTADGAGAIATINDGQVSEYLQCTNYGFAIPAGSTITGIAATIRRQASNSNVQDSVVVLIKGGVREAANQAVATTYSSGSYRDDSYGGSTNLWGGTWTVANINASNFGLALSAQKSNNSGGNRTVYIDAMTLSVTYAVPDTTPPTVSSIARTSPNPTGGVSQVSWAVTFSESVTGVDATDFALVQSGGVSGASILSVTGSGSTWTVTASTGSGTGSLGLNLVDDDSIRDLATNRLGGTGAGNGNFTGAVYTVTAIVCNPPGNIPAGVTVSCVCDNFTRSTLNPSPIFGQDWITSTSDSTGILPSIVNSGFLRLTNNSGNNAKAATVPAAFPAAGNYISVDFINYAYNGSGADGIAITLSDYSVPATPGAFGGSLGYAQRTGVAGFAGGWVGVAIDEYGNYQNPTEGRNGGPGFRVDSVGVRGSGSGNTGYRWLAGTAANLSPGIDTPGSTTPAPGHRYQVVVDARNAGQATPQTFVAVNRDTSGGSTFTPVVASFDAFAAAIAQGTTQAAVPQNWQISFTGSTGGSTNIHEVGALRICAQTVVPPDGGVAGGFSAIDEAYGTPAIAVQNYLTGRIYTKLAGTPFKFNIAALTNNQIQTGYVVTGSKNVAIKIVDNSDGVCVLNSSQANYCSAACQAKTAVAGGSQTLNFTSANAGQKQSADFTINDAWSRLAVIMSEGGVTACSTDSFAVRPLAFTSVSTTATNTALTGNPAFRAGTDTFGITVSTTTAGYTGNPAIDTPGMSANAAGWTLGAVSPTAFPAAVSSSTTGTFTYSEAGHLRFLGYDPASNTTSARGLYDGTWVAVDQGTQSDCIPNSYANTRDVTGTFASNPNYGKFGCRFGITANTPLFGRFVPDRFALTGSVTPFCPGPPRSFTYMGRPFNTGISYRLEARNAGGAPTVNYSASLGYPVVAPALVAEDQAAAHQGCDLASRLVPAPAPAGAWAAGVWDVSAPTAAFSRPSTVPPGALNAGACAATRAAAGGPFWDLDIGVQLVDGITSLSPAPDMNAGSTGVCTGAACNARRLGTMSVLLGRLNLQGAYGSDLLPLLVPIQAEYYNGSTWTLNTDDVCTSLAAANLGVGNVTQASGSSLALNSGSVTLTSTTLDAGRTTFLITPQTRGPGSVDLVLNLGLGVTPTTNWCGSNWGTGQVGGTGTTPNPDLSFMVDNWCGTVANKAPAARTRFGSPRVPYIYLRERY